MNSKFFRALKWIQYLLHLDIDVDEIKLNNINMDFNRLSKEIMLRFSNR